MSDLEIQADTVWALDRGPSFMSDRMVGHILMSHEAPSAILIQLWKTEMLNEIRVFWGQSKTRFFFSSSLLGSSCHHRNTLACSGHVAALLIE